MKIEIGHYTVGNQIFSNKLEAVLEAQKNNENFEWYFFDQIFSKCNWENEPNLSLDQYYRLRAEQIRKKYDYVIVFCSGGSDSNNVIKTFLDNNIEVDEVMALIPESGIKNFNFNQNDTTENNTISETKYSILPLLKEIHKKNSKIKITINDYFDDIIKYKDEDWTFDSCGNIVTILSSHFSNVKKFKHIDKLIESGKKIALVYGTDKPIVRIDENSNFLFVFSDAAVNYLSLPKDREHENLDRVLFYWTADFPEIVIKQAHTVASYLRKINLLDNFLINQNSISYLNFDEYNQKRVKRGLSPIEKQIIMSNHNQYKTVDLKYSYPSSSYRLLDKIIYPTYFDNNLFQCNKVNPDAGFFAKDQIWLHDLHKNHKVSQIVKSGIQTLYNVISPRFLNINGTGFVNKYKIYKFGNLYDKNY